VGDGGWRVEGGGWRVEGGGCVTRSDDGYFGRAGLEKGETWVMGLG
jgi:hypothetical protein